MLQIIKRFYWDIMTKSGRDAIRAFLIRDIPGQFGIMIRRKYYSRRFVRAGVNLNVLPGTYIINPENVECGDNVSIGVCNYLQAGGGIILGDNVMMGPYAKIWTQTHNFERTDIPIKKQGYSYDKVEIGEDVWLGANSFIMPGTRIGSHSIISACAVVSGKSYPEGIMLAGNPARKIGQRELS